MMKISKEERDKYRRHYSIDSTGEGLIICKLLDDLDSLERQRDDENDDATQIAEEEHEEFVLLQKRLDESEKGLLYYAVDPNPKDEDQGEDPRYWGIQGGYHEGQVARNILEKHGLWPPKKV